MLFARFGSAHPSAPTSTVERSANVDSAAAAAFAAVRASDPCKVPLIVVFIPVLFSEAHCLVFIGRRPRPCLVAMRFTKSLRLFNQCAVCKPNLGRIQLEELVMKIEVPLDITDGRSERSACSCAGVRPPTDAIRQFLIVAYRGKRRSVSLSSVLQELARVLITYPNVATTAATSAAIMVAMEISPCVPSSLA